MNAKERAKILHGLANVEAAINDTLQLLRLDRTLTQSDKFDCCIVMLEAVQEDMKYGLEVIEDEARWT